MALSPGGAADGWERRRPRAEAGPYLKHMGATAGAAAAVTPRSPVADKDGSWLTPPCCKPMHHFALQPEAPPQHGGHSLALDQTGGGGRVPRPPCRTKTPASHSPQHGTALRSCPPMRMPPLSPFSFSPLVFSTCASWGHSPSSLPGPTSLSPGARGLQPSQGKGWGGGESS